MKKIDFYILKTYIGPFFMTFFVVVFILLMQFLWKYVDELVGKGLELHLLLKLMFLQSFTFVPMALPLAILLSSLMTFGNLGERYELTAMKSAGVPLYTIMRSLIVFSIFCSVGGFVFANNIIPIVNLKAYTLLRDIRDQKPALNIEEGVFYKEIDNYVIRIGEKGKDNKTIHDVLIYDHTKSSENTTLTYAKDGTMSMSEDENLLYFVLKDGFIHDENFNMNAQKKGSSEIQLMRGTFELQQVSFDLSSFKLQHSDQESYKDRYEMFNVAQLDTIIDSTRIRIWEEKKHLDSSIFEGFTHINARYNDSTIHLYADAPLVNKEFDSRKMLKVYEHALRLMRTHKSRIEFNILDTESQQKNLWRYEIEWHRKYALSFACLLLFFVGAPLGAIIRKGGLGIPLVVSILIFVFYWVSSTIGERMARLGTISVVEGMWLSSALLFPLGIFLVYKASKESNLMNADAWNKFLYKFKLKKKRK